MRAGKALAWAFGSLLALLVLSAGALWLGGAEAAVWALEHPVSAMLGRQIRVGGSLTIGWGDPVRIVVEDFHIANASWSNQPEMLAAKRLEIDFFPASLLFGPTRISLIDIDGSRLLLETAPSGQHNWNFGAKTATPQHREQFPELARFTAKDSELVVHNGVTDVTTDLGVTRLEVDEPDPAADVSFHGTGTFQKHPLHLDGTLGAVATLRDRSKPYPVKLSGGIDRIELAVEGTLQEPLDFDGVDLRLSLKGTKLEEFAALLGVPLPQLPDFRGTSVLTGGNGNWTLGALSLALGKSDLEGGLAIDTNAKVPHIEANLTSTLLDLGDFAGVVGATPDDISAPAKKPDRPGRVLPDAPLPVHMLPSLNADLSFYGTKVRSRTGLPIDQVTLGLQLKDGTLRAHPLRFHTAQGDVDLNFDFTPFTKTGPPHLQAALDVRHIDLHELLAGPDMPAMAKQTRGILGGYAKIDTNGVSVRDFLGHANGDLGLFIQNGQMSELLEQLAPIDVLGALGVYLRGDAPVQINCLVGRFDIHDGKADASTLLLDTGDTQVSGAGNVNFANETLALDFKPTNKSFTSLSLRTPVHVDGTLRRSELPSRYGEPDRAGRRGAGARDRLSARGAAAADRYRARREQCLPQGLRRPRTGPAATAGPDQAEHPPGPVSARLGERRP